MHIISLTAKLDWSAVKETGRASCEKSAQYVNNAALNPYCEATRFTKPEYEKPLLFPISKIKDVRGTAKPFSLTLKVFFLFFHACFTHFKTQAHSSLKKNTFLSD